MPVNSMHADYLANAGVWKRSRDVLSEEDAVKAPGKGECSSGVPSDVVSKSFRRAKTH